MADVFYWGKRGSGKTLGAVIFEVWLDWINGNEIWSNTWLHPFFDVNYKTGKKGNLHQVDAVDLIKLLLDDKIPETETPKTLLLDEIKTQANARDFGRELNKHLTNFVSQARKRKFRMVYTDQILSAYDRWIRLMTDKIIRCVPIIDINNLGLGSREYPEPIYFEYLTLDLTEDELEDNDPIVFDVSRKTARNWYPCYKTEKIVTPVELKY